MLLDTDLAAFQQRFSRGLVDMLASNSPGALILVLANSLQDEQLGNMLRQPLIKAFNAFDWLNISGSRDDVDVMSSLTPASVDQLPCWETRKTGGWELVFNVMRQLRPSRLSSGEISVLRQQFDESGFHFNRPFLKPEILLESKNDQHRFRVLYNKFPFIPWHLLIVPDAHLELPQYLTADYHRLMWQLVSDQSNVMSGFGLGYNSLGAGASVNHLHFQGFIRTEKMPVEQQDWQHNDGDMAYPLQCFISTSVSESWQMIESFQHSNQPFNLLYRNNTCYILSRKLQGEMPTAAWLHGFGWYEACGVLTLGDRQVFDTLPTDQLHEQMAM